MPSMAKDGSAKAARQPLPREVWILATIAFCVAIGYGIVAPAVPGFARQFGVGRTLAGLVVSMFAAARLTTAFAGGKLVDRFGARRILTIGLVIVSVSSALAGLSQTYVQLLLLRGIGGVGSAMFTVASASVMASRVQSEIRGRAMSIYSGGFLLGGIAGPVLGGPLTQISLRLPFYFYAGTLMVAAFVAYRYLPRTPSDERSRAQVESIKAEAAERATPAPVTAVIREGARETLRMPIFRAAVFANFSASWSMAVRTATVPLFVTEALKDGPAMTGYGLAAFAAANGLALTPAGRLSDKWGRRPAMIAGAFFTAASLGMLAFPPYLPLFFAAMVVGGVGASMQIVGPASVAGDLAGGRKGSVLATFQMAGDVGVVFGPLIVNYTVDQVSYSAAFVVSAVIASLAAVFAILSRDTLRTRKKPAGDPAGQ